MSVPKYHGIEPHISLSYNSASGNGLVGVGWTLTGFSAVTERPEESSTGNSVYMLDDEELVPCTSGLSPGCDANGTHTTKNETYTRVIHSADSKHWYVTNPSGVQATYDQVGTNNRWFLAKVTDPAGYQVTYTYTCPVDDAIGRCYPDRVAYSLGTHPVWITFAYESRPDPAAYRIASSTSSTPGQYGKRLKDVLVLIGNAYPRVYHLDYTISGATGRSLLASVQEYGRDSTVDAAGEVTGSLLQTRSFGYNAAGPTEQWTGTATFSMPELFTDESESSVGYDRGLRTIDLDGDGDQDLVQVANSLNLRRAWLNSGGQWTEDDSLAANLPTMRLYDSLGNVPGYVVGFADFNGDGLTDIAANEDYGVNLWKVVVYINAGTGFFKDPDYDLKIGAVLDSVAGHDIFIDLNGDGRTDLLSLLQNKAWLNNPDGSAALGNRWLEDDGLASGLPTTMLKAVRVADVNGDGQMDILQNGYDANAAIRYARGAWLNNGHGFVYQSQFEPPVFIYDSRAATGDPGVRLADLNGDGRTDILRSYFDAAGNFSQGAWLSTGTGWVSVYEWAPYTAMLPFVDDRYVTKDTGRRLVDFNGDGAVDIIRSYHGGMPYYSGMLTSKEYDGNRVALPDVMTSATNGIGGSASIEYAPSTVWPDSHLPMVLPTVTRITLDDGRGTQSVYGYSYSGGLYDGVEQRLVGFAAVREQLPEYAPGLSGSRTTWYRQDYASAGKLWATELRDANDHPVRRQHLNYTDNGDGTPGTSLLTLIQNQSIFGSTVTETQVGYEYDAYGAPIRQTNYGDIRVADDESTTAISYTRNLSAYIVDRPSSVLVYDGLGDSGEILRNTEFQYDGLALNQAPTRGLTTKVRAWRKTPDEYSETRTEYTSAGEIAATYDALGHKTEFVRADGYFANETRDALYAEDSRHYTSVTALDPVCLLPLRATDLNGHESVYEYDQFCRPSSVTSPGLAVTSTSYVSDAAGLRQIRREAPSADGVSPQYEIDYYDGMGRVWKHEGKGPGGTNILSGTEYNGLGWPVREDLPHYSTEPALAYRTFEYDVLGRRTHLRHSDGTSIAWSYGALDEVITDERGAQRQIVRDALGRVSDALELVSGDWSGVHYEYDALGRRISAADDDGNALQTFYDALDNVIEENDPDRGMSVYDFDAAGLLRTVTEPNGLTCYDYDALGRRVAETRDCYGPGAVTNTWVYDEARTGYSNVGHLTTAGTEARDEFDFDCDGRMVRRARTVAGREYEFLYTPDGGGRLRSVRYPDGSTLGTTYDGAARVASIEGIANSVTYTADGQIGGWSNANGATVAYSYDPARRWLRRIAATHGSTILENFGYDEYYPSGLLKSVSGPNTYDSWTFGYDDASRLTSAQNESENVVYNYTTIGNISSSSEAGSYTYPPAGQARPHAPTSIGGASRAYDGAGNLVMGGGRYFVWSPKNLPARIASDCQFASPAAPCAYDAAYAYDADGERFLTRHNGSETVYLGDDAEVRDGTYTRYVRLGGVLTAKIVGAEVTWLYTDHLSSVRVAENSSGIIREAYEAYGAPMFATTVGGPGFTGQRLDPTGLVFLHARYYDPTVGQFVSPDSVIPTVWPMGMNRYAYGYGNPILYADPTGHWSWRQTSGIFQMLGGAVEIVAGGFLFSTCETGVGCYAAAAMIALGGDSFAAGARTVKSDEPSMPYVQQAFTGLGEVFGMSPQQAAFFGYVMNTSTHMLAGGAAGAAATQSGGFGGDVFLGSGAAGLLGIEATIPADVVGAAAGSGIGTLAGLGGLPAASLMGRVSDKGASTDKPSWVQEMPRSGEDGKAFATRVCDERYGPGNYPKGPGSEFSKIQKWANRHR